MNLLYCCLLFFILHILVSDLFMHTGVLKMTLKTHTWLTPHRFLIAVDFLCFWRPKVIWKTSSSRGFLKYARCMNEVLVMALGFQSSGISTRLNFPLDLLDLKCQWSGTVLECLSNAVLCCIIWIFIQLNVMGVPCLIYIKIRGTAISVDGRSCEKTWPFGPFNSRLNPF